MSDLQQRPEPDINDPKYWASLPFGRIKVNEVQAQLVYQKIHEAEVKAARAWMASRESPKPDLNLKREARLLEQVRRKLWALINEMDWNIPAPWGEGYPSGDG